MTANIHDGQALRFNFSDKNSYMPFNKETKKCSIIRHSLFILLTKTASTLARVILVIVTMSEANMHCNFHSIRHENIATTYKVTYFNHITIFTHEYHSCCRNGNVLKCWWMKTRDQLYITKDNGASHIVRSSHFCYESCETVGMHFQRIQIPNTLQASHNYQLTTHLN